ncbi:hypothetical protein TI39_contig465g00002 [Zymoseptoria brevis]|uniref:Uncharacterized protein n=1 Tax=Zymoseptoria brevis TaxID=1047168 RepID=A0A0F4GJZ6_9PEZI|nr:hypothetical protein TI39_contig465g00002 [Zymoseptoria brevis]
MVRQRQQKSTAGKDTALLQQFSWRFDNGDQKWIQKNVAKVRKALEDGDGTNTDVTSTKRRMLELGKWQLDITMLYGYFEDMYKSERFLTELLKVQNAVEFGKEFEEVRAAIEEAAQERRGDKSSARKRLYTPADASGAFAILKSKGPKSAEEHDLDSISDSLDEGDDRSDSASVEIGRGSGKARRDLSSPASLHHLSSPTSHQLDEYGYDYDDVRFESAEGDTLLQYQHRAGATTSSPAAQDDPDPDETSLEQFHTLITDRQNNRDPAAEIYQILKTADSIRFHVHAMEIPLTDEDARAAQQALANNQHFTPPILDAIIGKLKPLSWLTHPTGTVQDGRLTFINEQRQPQGISNVLLPVRLPNDDSDQWSLALVRTISERESLLSIQCLSQEGTVTNHVKQAVQDWCKEWKGNHKLSTFIFPPPIPDPDLAATQSLLLRAIFNMADVPHERPVECRTARIVVSRILWDLPLRGDIVKPDELDKLQKPAMDGLGINACKNATETFINNGTAACNDFAKTEGSVFAVTKAVQHIRDGVNAAMSLQSSLGVRAEPVVKLLADEAATRLDVVERLCQGFEGMLTAMRADNESLMQEIAEAQAWLDG